jgi:hypothetical protein
MSDLDHIQSFVNRWQYINKNKQTATGLYTDPLTGTQSPADDASMSLDLGRANFLTLANNKGRYYLYDNDSPTPRKWLPDGQEGTDYIFISDHNRSSAPFSTNRIGVQKRMINGKMRGYHVADKLTMVLSWTDLPSRAYSDKAGYSAFVNNPHVKQYTADGGAGGLEMLEWYQSHVGSMWAFFSFDAIPNIGVPDHVSNQGYARIYEMVIQNFDYEIKSRSRGWNEYHNTYSPGNNNQLTGRTEYRYGYDLWDVSMTLEEV